MLVVDLMHEFELGVWKAVFRHLIRILYAVASNGSVVTELDRRFLSFFLSVQNTYVDEIFSQLSTSAYLWEVNHPQIFSKCLRDEEARRS